MNSKLSHTHCSSLELGVQAHFCAKLIDSLNMLKEQLRDQFERVLPERTAYVRELIAEAEAQAWETPFPHLFFPDFAEVRLAEALAAEPSAFSQAA